MKFGTVRAMRRARPCRASASSTKPWGSLLNDTTSCGVAQKASAVGAAANGWPARAAITNASS
jgi:hypothetical protein